MKTTTHILEEYRGADLDKRLCMFLDAPDLRDAFMEIEHAEDRSGAADMQHRKRETKVRKWRFVFPAIFQPKRTHAG